MQISKFIVFVLALITALFLQFTCMLIWGWSPEFIIALLIVSRFYLDILETTALVTFSILIIDWRPAPGGELIFFVALLLAAIFAKRIFPWKNEINGVLGIILTIVFFYGLSNPSVVISSAFVFFDIVILTGISGAIMFKIFNCFYKILPA